MSEIVEISQKVTDMVAQIAAASEQQSSASEQISKNVEAISQVTQETSSGTQQVARTAEDLNRLTERLQSILEKFNLSAHSDRKTTAQLTDRRPKPAARPVSRPAMHHELV